MDRICEHPNPLTCPLDSGRRRLDNEHMRSLSMLGIYFRSIAVLFLLVGPGPMKVSASVFQIPHYLEPGEFLIGVESTVHLVTGSGVSGQVRGGFGLTDSLGAHVLVGHGNGPTEFRAGGGVTWDMVPDIDSQPGIGLSTIFVYAQRRAPSPQRFDALLIPYLHKSFGSGTDSVDPFISVPFGLSYDSTGTVFQSFVSFGGAFPISSGWSLIVEMAVAIVESESYVSGGLTYQF